MEQEKYNSRKNCRNERRLESENVQGHTHINLKNDSTWSTQIYVLITLLDFKNKVFFES